MADTCLRWNPDDSSLHVLTPHLRRMSPRCCARYGGLGLTLLLLPVYGSLSNYSCVTVDHNRGYALSKNRLSHRVIDAIKHTYGASGCPFAIWVELPLHQMRFDIMGCTKRCTPGDDMCRGIMDVAWHIQGFTVSSSPLPIRRV